MEIKINKLRESPLFWQILIGVLVFIGLTLAGTRLKGGIDWYETFYPTARAVLSGKSPYTLIGFRYVPWAVIPILPFAWLPPTIGRAAFLVFSLFVFAFVAYKMGGNPIVVGTFVASPPVVHCLLNANIDWMTLIGFILPPQIGLFFVVIKPQLTAGLVLFWLIEAWRKGGLKEVVRVFSPVSISILLSFVFFGFWPERFLEPIGFDWNASLWPMSIPIGVVLLTKSIRQRSDRLSMAASPLLSPYVLLHSWSGALISLAGSTADMLAAVLGLWILVIIRSTQIFG